MGPRPAWGETQDWESHLICDAKGHRFKKVWDFDLHKFARKAIRVAFDGDYETTCTRNTIAPGNTIVSVRPNGPGWEISDASHDKRTFWERKVVVS